MPSIEFVTQNLRYTTYVRNFLKLTLLRKDFAFNQKNLQQIVKKKTN